MEYYSVTTTKTIEEAISEIGINLRRYKFNILWQMNIPDKLQEKGVHTYMNPYRVLEVINPHDAADALNRNEVAGYFLPCKIVVYKSKGVTVLGLPKPTAYATVIDDPELKEMTERIERNLIEVLELSK